jgi:hypothetical protein
LIVARQLKHEGVLAVLADLFIAREPPANIRFDSGAAFIATAVLKWLANVGVKTLYITPASPWENRNNESFNGPLRDELLNGEIFYSLAEPKVPIEAWWRHYFCWEPDVPVTGVTPYNEPLMVEFCMDKELVEHSGKRAKLTCIQNQKLDKINEQIEVIKRVQEQRLSQISEQIERIRADAAYNFPIQQFVVVAILFILTLTLWRAW